jgi:hypothetical protein
MTKHKWAQNLVLKSSIKKSDYDYYEIVKNSRGEFYRVHGYSGNSDILNKVDLVEFDCNWDMTWNCEFVKKYKDNSFLLKII